MLKYCRDRYKTQKMCGKAVDDFLPAVNFADDWFVTSKMIKKLHNALFTDDDKLFFDENSCNVRFPSDEIGFLSLDLNNINLDDVNFEEDDPETHISLMVWRNKSKKRKAFKKN